MLKMDQFQGMLKRDHFFPVKVFGLKERVTSCSIEVLLENSALSE